MIPKICTCGKQGNVIDSRQRDDHVVRRYRCECGEKWYTYELRFKASPYDGDVKTLLAREYSTVDRDNVADRLIEIAQELLR